MEHIGCTMLVLWAGFTAGALGWALRGWAVKKDKERAAGRVPFTTYEDNFDSL